MFKRLFSSQLRINMVSGVAVTVVNSAVLVVAYPLYLHFLGYEQYGIWLVLSTVLSFAQLGNLGIGPAVTKLVAEEYGRKNLEAVQQYVASAVAILVVSGAVVVGLILLFRMPIVALFKLSPENAKTVLWLLPYMACLSAYVFVVQAVNAVLAGLGRMDLANYVQTGGRILTVVVSTTLLVHGLGITSLLLGSVLSYLFVHAISQVAIWRLARIHVFRVERLDVLRVEELLRFGTGVFGGSIISLLTNPFNKLMLSRYVGVASIPIYEITYQAGMQIRALLEAGFRALLPEVSRVGSEMTIYAKHRISRLYRHATAIAVALGIPMCGLLALFSTALLKMWLRNQFVDSLPGVFRIMLIPVFLSLAGVPAYYILLGLGKVRCYLLTSIIGAAGNFLLVVGWRIVSGGLSVHGVALSLAMSYVVPLVYLVWTVHRLLLSDAQKRDVASPAVDSRSTELKSNTALV